MKQLSRAEVAALIHALADRAASVRLTALRAIVRLPLTRDVWLEVSRHVETLLNKPPTGEEFARLTVDEIPYHELIEAAIFVPTRFVRSIVQSFLAARDPQVRSMVAHALATGRDPVAIPQLISELSEESETRRIDAAKSLSLVASRHSPAFVIREVKAAYESEADHDVRFWLALTLAVSGETTEIVAVLNGLREGTLELKELYGDPSQLIKQLEKRGPFPENARDIFESIALGKDDFTAEAALTLRRAQLPAAHSGSPESSPTPPHDPELEALAASVVQQIKEGGVLNSEEMKPAILVYLPPELVAYVVTLMFREAVEYDEFAGPGNDIVTAVHELGDRFTPELEKLFDCYLTLWKTPDVTTALFYPWSLRWQLAWTVSRAEIRQILKTISPTLERGDEEARRLAAQLVEDTILYSKQDYPPIFGGGSGPEDVLPVMNQFIDDELPAPEGSSRDKSAYDSGADHQYPIGGSGPRSLADEGEYETATEAEPVYRESEPEGGADTSSEPSNPDIFGLEAMTEESGGPERLVPRMGMEEESSQSSDEKLPTEIEAEPTGVASEPETARPDALPKRPSKKVINTGFASRENPDKKIYNTQPLTTGEKYFFWLDRSVPQKRASAEETPVDIQADVPQGARLTVAVFGFKDGIQVQPGGDIGELEIGRGRNFNVINQPLQGAPEKSRYLNRRLFFPVQMPPKAGMARMRCNIYWKQTLLQSRLIEARVVDKAESVKSTGRAVRSILDYSLTNQLDPAQVRQVPEHRVSILLNNNGDGTNSFHIFGSDGQQKFKQDDLRFREGELQGMIDQARGTLRIASWDNADEWKQGVPYKYKDGKKQLKRLQDDLINLAKWGYEFYTQVQARLAGPGKEADPQALPVDPVAKLEELMLKPGVVQLAMKESPTYVLPAAMIYDYPLDAGSEAFSLCPSFENAFNQNASLQDLDCFKGNCPSRTDLTTICPSGFWGFRHYLGMPLSVKDGPPVATTIDVKGDLKMAVGVATNLGLVKTHTDAVKQLRPGMLWAYAETRAKVFDAMRDSPHIVYFYCHGGFARKAPFLQVGTKDLIQRSNLYAYKIIWNAPRPLVFINGCHTTAVEPQQALEFISPLITYSRCAGVIGTEITIFEELATVFAEECLQRFYAGESIGEAIRNARLKLLAGGNPLGLVYIPYVISGLRLNYQN